MFTIPNQLDWFTWCAIITYGYSVTIPLARWIMLECVPTINTLVSLFLGAIIVLTTYCTTNPTGKWYWSGLSIIFMIYTYIVQLRGPIPPRVNMRTKTIIVTGANSGIGLETTRQLCQMGATVIMGCRSIERSKPMMDDINNDILVQSSNGKAILLATSLDLNNLNSVRQWVTTLINNGYTEIDALVCNAGLFIPSLSTHKEIINKGTKNETTIEIEDSFVSNHLGHHLLIHLLLPYLHNASLQRYTKNIKHETTTDIIWGKNSPSRIILVSSSLHKLANKFEATHQYLDWYKGNNNNNNNNKNDDKVQKPTLQEYQSKYNQWKVYGAVKLAEMLCAKYFEHLLTTSSEYAIYKNTIHINTLHPGNPVTGVTQNLPYILRLLEKIFYPFMFLYRQTCTQGAYNSVWTTTHPQALSGQNQYYIHMEPSQQNPVVYDFDAAKEIYEYSEYLCQE